MGSNSKEAEEMRIALFVIILLCGFIVDKLEIMPDFNRILLCSIGGASLFWDYWESKKRRKK